MKFLIFSLLVICSSAFGQDLAVFARGLGSGKVYYEKNINKPLVPASVTKLLTTWASLVELGPEFSFPTEFWRVGDTLYVRGYGDPSLRSEELSQIAEDLLAIGVDGVKKLVIDDSLITDPVPRTGSRPYQAGGGGVSLNFNCIKVLIMPDGRVSPTAGTSYRIFNQVGQKTGRLQGTLEGNVLRVWGSKPDKVASRYFAVEKPWQYFGEVFNHYLGKSLFITRGTVPEKASLIYKHNSKPLWQILADLNRYSSNFIASQITAILGQDPDTGLFSRQKGVEKLNAYLRTLDPSLEVSDGSGLERKNRLSVRAVVEMIDLMSRDLSLYPYFLSSLSRFGHSGTLKDREVFSVEALGKTGSLTGVSSLAGVAQAKNGEFVAYAIISNNGKSRDKAQEMEEKILAEIAS